MKISLQTQGMAPHQPLQDYLEKKIGKLDTFYDKIVECKVYLKAENTTDKGGKTAEIVIHIPGDELVVKKSATTFEESIDQCVEAAKKQLIKRKEILS